MKSTKKTPNEGQNQTAHILTKIFNWLYYPNLFIYSFIYISIYWRKKLFEFMAFLFCLD